MSSPENIDELPTEIQHIAATVVQGLLPEKSRDRYNAAYEKFCEWQTSHHIQNISEAVMLTYFQELSQTWQAPTLWAHYSMVKSTLRMHQNIDIGKYNLLITYLKRQSTGFRSKKSKTLSSQNIERFLKEAPDVEYLATKAALIFGVCGACRSCELTNITTADVKEHDGIYLVKIPVTKNDKPRSFTIEDDFYNIVKKFVNLRPQDVDTSRFFLNYQHGHCLKQPIGKNKFASMPKQIARYLGLDDAESYTGHSFRRTSATLLADSGANITTIKRHGGWRSDSVAEGYIDESVENKRKVGKMITSAIHLKPPRPDENSSPSDRAAKSRKVEPSTSKLSEDETNEEMSEEFVAEQLQKHKERPIIILPNCTNCTITFN